MIASAAAGPLEPSTRPQTPQPAAGTAQIRGAVVDAATGVAVRRATLRLRMVAPTRSSWTTVTDGDGAFVFPGLPKGRFTLSASKGGFLSLGPGQRSSSDAARPIETSEGGTVDLPPIQLPRGGVITGRIVDEYGDPVPEITVQTFRAQYLQGMRRLVSVRSAQTNDIGQYRIYGLQPGTYYVAGSRRGADGNPHQFVEPRTEAVGGDGGLAPTFFPGTVSSVDAQRIEVSGAEIPGVDFSLLAVSLVRISGSIADSRGKPAGDYVVMLNPARSDHALLGGTTLAEVDADGRFTVANVAPGEYRLDVRSKRAIEALAESGSVGQSQRADAPEFASVPITITGEDIAGVSIKLTSGHRMTGRVLVDGAAPDSKAVNALRVSVMSAITGVSAVMLSAGAPVGEEGTFEVRGLLGRRFVRVNGLPPGWALESVRAGGMDVTDEGIEIREDVQAVDVLLTSRRTQVSGVVTDEAGNQVPDAAVIIFPEARERRTAPLNRFVTSTRAGNDGAFTVHALPAATYLAVAVPSLVDGEWAAPEQLERLTTHATRFTLAPGESKRIALRVRF